MNKAKQILDYPVCFMNDMYTYYYILWSGIKWEIPSKKGNSPMRYTNAIVREIPVFGDFRRIDRNTHIHMYM